MKEIRNKKRILVLLVLLCLVSVVLLLLGRSGKNRDDTAALIGKWDMYGNDEYVGTITFNGDGTYISEIVDDGETHIHNGTWRAKNGLFYDTGLAKTNLGRSVTFKLDGDTLTLTGGSIKHGLEVMTLVRSSRQ